jgi:hypothetical protein
MHAGNGEVLKIGDRVTLKEIARAHIRYWLEKTGTIKGAAAVVGIKAGSLSRKIEREKIAWTKNAAGCGEEGASAGSGPVPSGRPDCAETSTDD